jgi:tetratricopeptide (TPR) repeat protein
MGMVFKGLRDLAARVRKFGKAKNIKHLSRRAVQLYHEGQYSQAVSLAEEALELARQVWGEEHPNIATSLNNLAVLYKLQGSLAEVEPLYQEALAMRKRLFPTHHPDVATSLNNLAFLYKSQGRLAQAEPLLEEALAMSKRLLPGDHPDVAKGLNNLAILLAATSRYPEALELMKEATAIDNRLISQAFATSSERDRLAYLQLFRKNFEAFLSLVSKHLHHSPQAVQAALDLVLQRKALTAAALAALHQAIYSGRYPHLTEELKKLRELSDQIIHFTFTEPKPKLIGQLQALGNFGGETVSQSPPELGDLGGEKNLCIYGSLAGEGLGERSKLGVLGTQAAELLQTLAGSAFPRAEGTRFLGEGVAKLLGVSPYLDKEALASRLTGCQSPEILLIATHGLFSREVQLQDYVNLILALLTCPDEQEAELLQKNRKLLDNTLLEVMEKAVAILAEGGNQKDADRLRNFAPQVAAMIDKSTQQTPIQNPPNSPYQGGNFKIPNPEDPMLRSALAFAGANTWLKGKTLPKEAGKGLVFAQDVAALDLWATELAVLCACNTAMGDIKIGEGVFGLRRAFAVAGAKTLVMSLWSVPDRATALLMQRFFTNLQQGLGRANALQEAQNYIRTITVKELQHSHLGQKVLEELEKLTSKESKFFQDDQPLEHPYFWGAWVCQGDTTAMVMSTGR